MKSSPTLIKAFIIFPLNVMVVIPALILWFSGRFQTWTIEWLTGMGGAALIALGFYVIWETVSIFTDYGEGTPAPWEPPKKLVVLGIYRNVRNPMMIGVLCVLVGESIQKHELPGLAVAVVFPYKRGEEVLQLPINQYKDYNPRQRADHARQLAKWLTDQKEHGLVLAGFVHAHTGCGSNTRIGAD